MGAALAGLLSTWAARLQVATVLERVVGGAAPACGAIAAGRQVICVADDEAAAARARRAYGGGVDVRAAADDRALPKCDLVVVSGAPGAGGDWRGPLASLLRHGVKLAVVVADNPGRIDARARAFLRKGGDGWGETSSLAAVLWELGRVRDHVWLDAPAAVDRAPRLARSLARRHAFVVDMTPRSPQARRKLRLSGESA